MEELQAEMKLLNWHKLANEAALKVRKFFIFNIMQSLFLYLISIYFVCRLL